MRGMEVYIVLKSGKRELHGHLIGLGPFFQRFLMSPNRFLTERWLMNRQLLNYRDAAHKETFSLNVWYMYCLNTWFRALVNTVLICITLDMLDIHVYAIHTVLKPPLRLREGKISRSRVPQRCMKKLHLSFTDERKQNNLQGRPVFHPRINSLTLLSTWLNCYWKYTLFICQLKKGFLIDSTQPFNHSLGLNNSYKHLLITSFKHSPFRTTVHTFISTNSQSFHHPFDLSHLKRFFLFVPATLLAFLLYIQLS